MIALIGYLFLIFALILFLIGISIYTLFLIYSSLMGSPYVPTKQKEIDIILKEARLKKKSLFIDLGCGDGRVVATAVHQYHVQGIGIDVNPILLYIAGLKSRRFKLSCIVFKKKNIFDEDLHKADYIYLFLMPELITKLKPKLAKELKKGAILISHGFKISGWEKKACGFLDHRPFPTYYYRIS